MAREDGRPSITASSTKISLVGSVDDAMACKLRDDLAQADGGSDPLVIDMTTLGGDPEMARRMIAEIDDTRERLNGRRLVFLGKSVVYSAGVTFMAGFPREDRYLRRDTMLLIHSRQLCQTLQLDGPLRSSVPMIRAMLHQLETGIDLETKYFERLIAGSKIGMDDLLEKALYNWYVGADEACDLGLVNEVV